MFRRILALAVPTALLALVAMFAPVSVSEPASAAVPPSPAVDFIAPACPGTTVVASPSRQISGQRLVDYNAGRTVAVYDSYGYPPVLLDNDNGFPPLCGVQYLTEAEGGPAGGGPVAAWMFCTHVERHACNDGRPLEQDPSQNPDLDDSERAVIAHLVRNGHSYTPSGSWPMAGASPLVAADGSSAERAKLQYLIWCISDAGAISQLDAFCALNGLDPASVARDYAYLQSPAAPELAFVDPAPASVTVGDTVTLTLRSNVYGVPIIVDAQGGSLVLCPGASGATLSGTELRIDPPASADTTVDVPLCVTATVDGSLTVAVSGLPTTVEALNWYHNGDQDCQVYAAFGFPDSELLSAAATAVFTPTQVTSLGGFSIRKDLDLATGVSLAPGTVFTVDYDCGPGVTGSLPLVVGVPQTVTGIPVGAQCTLREPTPIAPQGGRWQDALWSPGAVAGAEFVVSIVDDGSGAPVALSLTNRAVPTTPSTPATPAGTVEPKALADTGATPALGLYAALVALVLGTLALLPSARSSRLD